jgi:putative DNA primase/helicase
MVDRHLHIVDDLGEGAQEPDGPFLPSPKAPLNAARSLIEAKFTHEGQPTIRHWRGRWLEWQQSYWAEVEENKLHGAAYEYFAEAMFLNKKQEPEPWHPDFTKICKLFKAAAAALCHLDGKLNQPLWIGADCGQVIACANGLLHLERRELLPLSPLYFNQTAAPFDYDAEATEPREWLSFLASIWGDDAEQIEALQEWLGYIVSSRTDQQKILLLVGPARAGKGTIARGLISLVGKEHVAGPTLSGLQNEFGLAPLIGKSLAVISDARMTGRSHTVVERLLTISGEDTVTVNVKLKPQWTGRLPCRFMIISNEIPQLQDTSGAIASRFVALTLTKSFEGAEDTQLGDKLAGELAGILNWSLEGLDHLQEQGRFTRPASTAEAMETLRDLASPLAAFIRKCCVLDPGQEVLIAKAFSAYQTFCEEAGYEPTEKTAPQFGTAVRSIHSQLKRVRRGPKGDQHHAWVGIGLRP